MSTVYKPAIKLRFIRLVMCWAILISFGISACQVQTRTPQLPVTWTPSDIPSGFLSASHTPNPPLSLIPTGLTVSTSLPNVTHTAAPSPTLSPSPTLIGPQLVLNSGFDTGLLGWEQSYGDLRHTATEYHTGPGAARLVTTTATGFLDFQGNAGQCIELNNVMQNWPDFEGQFFMTLEAYFRTDPEITKVSLNGIFLTEPGCRTGQVGYFDLPTLDGNQPWTRLAGTILIPAEAVSFHVFVTAYGTIENAAVYIDDIRAYSSPPPSH